MGRLESRYPGPNKSSEDQLTNLIAAKLLSESIELAKYPYTDEVTTRFDNVLKHPTINKSIKSSDFAKYPSLLSNATRVN